MSFSSEVKNELLNYFDSNRHCNIAELAAIFYYLSSMEHDNEKGGRILKVQSENISILEKCSIILEKFFNIKEEIKDQNNKSFSISIRNEKDIERLLYATGFINESGQFSRNINPIVVGSVCCKRAFIRGSFICCGSLCDPEKNYHLEFVNSDIKGAETLMNQINSFDVESKIIERKSHFIVYIKEGEQIVDILNIMNAHISLMNLENVRILKDVRNNVNRIVNCETANLNKVVSASVRQREDIEFIASKIGLDKLPGGLAEIAQLRLEFPDASLKELGEMLTPIVGKSGVNHRLKKIHFIAEDLKEAIIND